MTMNILLYLTLLTCAFCIQATENKDMSQAVIIETTEGPIEITLFPKIAPKAVENFTTHAKNGYYNGTIFHRVIKDFMVQGGDPEGNGTGGESIWGEDFEDEFDPSIRFDRKGLLAMANRGPKTNGSQFFITTAETPWLNNRHTIFGEVTKAYDIVDKIQSVETNSQDKPLEPIKIKSIKVLEKSNL